MISVIHFFIKQKFCKHQFFCGAEHNDLQRRDSFKHLFTIWFTLVSEKYFVKGNLIFLVEKYPFEHGFIQAFLMSAIRYRKPNLKIEFLNSIFMYIILLVCLFFCGLFCLITKLSECFIYAVVWTFLQAWHNIHNILEYTDNENVKPYYLSQQYKSVITYFWNL